MTTYTDRFRCFRRLGGCRGSEGRRGDLSLIFYKQLGSQVAGCFSRLVLVREVLIGFVRVIRFGLGSYFSQMDDSAVGACNSLHHTNACDMRVSCVDFIFHDDPRSFQRKPSSVRGDGRRRASDVWGIICLLKTVSAQTCLRRGAQHGINERVRKVHRIPDRLLLINEFKLLWKTCYFLIWIADRRDRPGNTIAPINAAQRIRPDRRHMHSDLASAI
jgi:hypothetical protein